jgi:hypothetical protein
MKPWFVKEIQEADIIKFPEPERKVIKMPSVSEYPDFITGVLDLQARRDKEQIGQDSYDKLYQDLIHRFMKKESFETPWFLREKELQPKKSTLQIWKNLVKSRGIQILKYLYNGIKKWLSAKKPQPNTQPNQNIEPSQKPVESLNEQNIAAVADDFIKQNEEFARDTAQSIKQKSFEALQGFEKLLGKLQEPMRNFYFRIWDEHTPEEYNKVIDWLASKPGLPLLEKSKKQSVDVLQDLKTSNPNETAILSKYNGLNEIARIASRAGEGRGELFLAQIMGGNISGGGKGAKGDIKIGTDEYEVKTQGMFDNVKRKNDVTPFSFGDTLKIKEPMKQSVNYFFSELKKLGVKNATDSKGKIQLGFNNFGDQKGMVPNVNALKREDALRIFRGFLEYYGKLDETAEEVLEKVFPGSDGDLNFNHVLFRKLWVYVNYQEYESGKAFKGLIMMDAFTAKNGNRLIIRTIDQTNIKKAIFGDKNTKPVIDAGIETLRSTAAGQTQAGTTAIRFLP